MHLLRMPTILALVLAMAHVASAGSLRLSDNGGVTWVTITDNTPGDISPSLGAITFNGAVGNFNINVTTGISKPILGGTNDPVMDLNSVNVSGSGPGTLTIQFTDVDFGSALHPGFITLVGGTTSGTVAVASYYDLGNATFATTSLLSDLGTFGPGAYSGTGSTDVGPLPGPYSLTLMATITHTAAGQVTSFDLLLHPNPEPSTLALMGAAGVLGFVAVRRRRRSA